MINNFLFHSPIVLLFPTIEFSLFFLLTFTIWLAIKHTRYRLIAICFFNIIFYISYSPIMFLYLFIWTCLIWISGKYLKLKYLVIGTAILSLAFWRAVEAKLIPINIATPLGVSFFTFQGLTYLFARIKLPSHKPEEHINDSWHFLKVFAFIGFFPTIFSGPILRAKKWENSLINPIDLNQKTFNYAFLLIALGAFYKLCLSSILHDYVSLAYASPAEENSLNLLIGMYAYTFEIYHDFAGYSLMAIGISLLYGFYIPENFKQPYLSHNIKDFWQKWHMSFSFWLRDYFYISLGGSRNGQLKHLRNTMIVMLICGAWHGLSSNYLVWGFLHGSAVIFYHFIKGKLKLPIFISWIITFHYVAVAWIFFRSPNASIAILYINGLFKWNDYIQNISLKTILIFILFIICLLFQILEKKLFTSNLTFENVIFKPYLNWLFWGLIFIFILVISPSGMPPFIYFSY